MIFGPSMSDCLLSIQHHFYLQRWHFLESPSNIVLGQSLSMKGMQDTEDGREERLLFLGIVGMSPGWIWGNRDSRGSLGMPTWLYRLRCLAGTFPEPLENFSSLPMKLLTTTKFGSSNEICSDCFNHLQPQPSLSSLMQLFLRSRSP